MLPGKNKAKKWDGEGFALLDPMSVMEVPLKERHKGGEEPVEQLPGEDHPR